MRNLDIFKKLFLIALFATFTSTVLGVKPIEPSTLYNRLAEQLRNVLKSAGFSTEISPDDLAQFTDNVFLDTIFPQLVKKLLEDSPYGYHEGIRTIDGVCFAVKNLVKLRLISKRFNTLLINKENIQKIMLNAGMPPDSVKKNPYTGETPLHYSASKNNPTEIKALIMLGADPNARIEPPGFIPDQWGLWTVSHLAGWTPLHLAAFPNKEREWWHDFHQRQQSRYKEQKCGCRKPRSKLMEAMDVFKSEEPEPQPPIEDTRKAINALLAAGADPNARINNPISEHYNCTPLDLAVSIGNTYSIKTLLDAKARVSESKLPLLEKLGFNIPEEQIERGK